ncbi:MAG: recombination protein O N-terminal domain-containing protein [Lentisphaeria bacterium]
MTTTPWQQCEFLVLRKTLYSETSLVLAGVSPEHGQLHFMARGARRWGRRDFPVADLFRVLAVTFRPGRGDLHSWQQAELVEDLGGLARHPDAYAVAMRLAKFALANTPAALPAPRFCGALRQALRWLADTPPGQPPPPAAWTGAVLAFLDEHGLLSLPGTADSAPPPPPAAALLAAIGAGRTPPAAAPPDWEQLEAWLHAALSRAECR